jgi:hypothetical protein
VSVYGAEDAIVHSFGGFDVSEARQYAAYGVVGVGRLIHLCASFLEPLAEAGACAEEQGSYCGFALSQNAGNLCGGEVFYGGEQKDVTLCPGEFFHLGEDALDALGFVEGVVWRCGVGGEAFGEALVELLWAYATAAVDGEIPSDADEPDAHVANAVEALTVFEDANEGVLYDVLGLGGAVKDGVGDAKEEARVCLDEGGEVDVGLGTFSERQRQA